MGGQRKAGLQWLAIVAWLVAPLAGTSAQQTGSGADRSGQRAVELWAGMSRRSSQWGQLGDMPDEMLALTAFRFTQRVRRTTGLSLEYGIDLIPMAMMSPPYHSDVAESCSDTSCTQAAPDPRPGVAAHGAGINPVSLTAVFRPDHALQFRAGASGGALWFDQRVPTTTAARFNFTGTVEFGAQVIGMHGNGLVLMYRFHHLSNAGRGTDNPGIASHLISLGARWRIGQPGT